MSELSALSNFPIDDIQTLRSMVEEVKSALRNQDELLRMRGMNLPPGSLDHLDSIDNDLKQLHKNLVNESSELLQLRTLAETSAMLNSSRDLDTVLARAMDEVIQLTEAERGYIVLIDPDTGERQLRIGRDIEAKEGAALTFEGSSTVLNEVLNTGEPLLADNAYKDPRLQVGGTVMQRGLRSVLCVPLKNKEGQVDGAVYVDNRLQSGIFNQREMGILAALANQMAVAIENARLFMQGQANLIEITQINEVRENVFGSIGSGVLTTHAPDDAIRTVNNAAANIIASTKDAILNQPLCQVLPAINGDHIRVVHEDNQSQSFESEMETSAGRRIIGLKLSPLKDAAQHTQGVAVVVDDLTEQKERDDKLNILRRYLPRAMVDNIQHIAGLALGGERRELTCMYVEGRSLATFPPDLRPPQVMELLNEYHHVATNCINETEGVIDKYMGTEIMALFNTQLNPQEDHAYRALVAAQLMRDSFQDLNRRLGLDPQQQFFRVGIHSGVATTGNVGSLNRRDFTALGDTINLAHRLLENAKPGQIIVSEECCQYIHNALGKYPDDVVFGEQEPIKVKGRQQVTTIFEVLKA
ncbi:MAG: GAF domain-containing protein [Anaerolineae bacterium]